MELSEVPVVDERHVLPRSVPVARREMRASIGSDVLGTPAGYAVAEGQLDASFMSSSERALSGTARSGPRRGCSALAGRPMMCPARSARSMAPRMMASASSKRPRYVMAEPWVTRALTMTSVSRSPRRGAQRPFGGSHRFLVSVRHHVEPGQLGEDWRRVRLGLVQSEPPPARGWRAPRHPCCG